MPVWPNGNGIVHINKTTPHISWLVLRWVSIQWDEK